MKIAVTTTREGDEILNNKAKVISKDLNIPIDTIKLAYKTYWQFIREHISELPLKECTEEQLEDMKCCFYLPYIGKLYCNKDTFQRSQKNNEIKKNLKKKI